MTASIFFGTANSASVNFSQYSLRNLICREKHKSTMILMILLLLQDSLYSFLFILFAFEVEMYGGNHLTILSLHTYRIRQIAEIAFSRRLLQRKNT